MFLQQLCVQLDSAVVKGGDFKLAKLDAVIAGHLGLDLGGFGLGERRKAHEGDGPEGQ